MATPGDLCRDFASFLANREPMTVAAVLEALFAYVKNPDNKMPGSGSCFNFELKDAYKSAPNKAECLSLVAEHLTRDVKFTQVNEHGSIKPMQFVFVQQTVEYHQARYEYIATQVCNDKLEACTHITLCIP